MVRTKLLSASISFFLLVDKAEAEAEETTIGGEGEESKTGESGGEGAGARASSGKLSRGRVPGNASSSSSDAERSSDKSCRRESGRGVVEKEVLLVDIHKLVLARRTAR